jgi:hypothetical protein
MPEGGWRGLEHVACSVECNKFVVFHKNKFATAQHDEFHENSLHFKKT